jgi:hypothetical protein
MILFCLLEGFTLFIGTILWFLITQKGNALVTTNFATVFNSLIQDAPPIPNVDIIMWMRIGLLMLLAYGLHEDFQLSVNILEELWDEVIVFIWDLIADFGQIVVFFADLIVPLYNWYVTLASQLTTGSYTILAKCQIKTIIESLVFVGEAMGFLANSIKDFILNPKGAFDIHNTVSALQTAIVTQESVIQCACDGITPAFGIAFDVIRPPILANIANETFNAFVAVPQTAVLAIPPWSHIPDASKILQPLKRAAEYSGTYMDTVAQNILTRILGTTPPNIPIFSTVGFAAQGALGLAEMLMHSSTRIILLQPITFNPKLVHESFIHMADSLEETTQQILTAVVIPLNLINTDANTNNENLKEAVQPFAKTLGFLTKAAVGLPMSIIDEIFFILRNDNAGLTFMQTLQRWDGHWGKTKQNGITMQEHFFQNIDKATYEAEKMFLAFSYIPVGIRSASRLLNVALRILLSAEDIVQDRFFHTQINCGYGVKEDCSTDCTFYYDPMNPYLPENNLRLEDSTNVNPCNSLITEWVFNSLEDFSNVLAEVFKKIRPQHSAGWCNTYEYPKNSNRCAKSNTDFMCATSTTLKETVDVPLNALRHAYSVTTLIFAKEDILKMNMEDRLCDLSIVLYAIAGNAVAIAPNEIVSADFKQEITNLMHSVIVLPVYVIRAYAILAQYAASVLTETNIYWDDIIQDIDKELINGKYRQLQTTTMTTESSIALAENTASFVAAEIALLFNYGINVFDSAALLIGGDKNFFTGIANMISVLKNSLSKEMINIVTLVFKITTNMLAMITQGRTDLGELAEDIVIIVKKTIGIIGTMVSQILASILKLLGPVGEFLTFLWKGICSAGDVIEWLTGADFSSVCDAVDNTNLRRRLENIQSTSTIKTSGWDGDSECDLLAQYYNGKTWKQATHLEQIRLVHCSEQRATMQKINHILNTTLPQDLIYNWKSKYHMAYQMSLGFIIYMKHQNKQQMLDEWDRLDLPRYYLDLWSRIKLDIPWVSVLDEALTQSIAPVPELANIYEESKNTLIQLHTTWHEHNMHDIQHIQVLKMPKFHGMVLGSQGYQTIITHHTFAWGLKTNIDINGPLECTVADNFVLAMTDASNRLNDYYTGPFIEYTLPNFIAWMKETPLPLEMPNTSAPVLRTPTKMDLKNGILYSFEKCEAEHILCNPDESLQRIERITESLYYILYCILAMGSLSILTGVSLFPLLQIGAPLIILAHTWNYRLTCAPNIPDCLFDDTLRWIQSYRPKTWDNIFPELAKNQTCTDNNYIWSSAYFIAKTPLKKPIEFILYQNNDLYNTWGEWTEQTALRDECAFLRAPDIVFTPALAYAIYSLWGVFTWAANAIINLSTTIIPILSTINAIEQKN